MDLDAMVDRVVTLSGTAENAIPWAVVTGPDFSWLVYVEGLRRWDTDDYGKTVEVTGLLVWERVAPEHVVIDGAHMHGAVGKAYIMRDAEWQFPH
jgi:hypothetical protein